MSLDFGDFDVTIDGDPTSPHLVQALQAHLEQAFYTPVFQFVPGGPTSDDAVLFDMLPGVQFDTAATVDGQLGVVTSLSDQTTHGSIDLVTGEVRFDYDLTEFVNNGKVELTGSATTAQVLDIAPTVTAPATVSANATTSSCAASVTLTASASSAIGLPVSLSYTIDGSFGGDGPSVTTTLPIGTHEVFIVASDNVGARAFAPETVTVNDETAPAFGSVPTSETVQGCSAGSSAVPVTVPTASNVCSGVAATVTGSVITFNGAPVSIPVVNGTVNVPPGSGTLSFVATNANGVTSTVNVPLTVLAPATFLGTQGVAVDNASVVNGTVYSGAGGQLLLQNDAHVGSVFSLSPVVLQDRVHSPFIDASAGITLGHNDVIGSTSGAVSTLPSFPSAGATFTGGQSVTVNPFPQAGDVVTLAPGEYGAVTVYSGGHLVLSAGNYEFASLDLEPNAQLIVPSASAETARVFVQNTVIYRGSTTTASSTTPPAPLFLAYAGSAPLNVSAAFTGTVIAPGAQLNLQSLNGSGVYSGEFFARQITLFPNTTVNSNPFTCVP
jgi:hypothetical protein